MQTQADAYLSQVNSGNRIRSGARQTILLLSLLVTLGVFWSLKLTGITLAGEAFCGMAEHVHSEECLTRTLLCTQKEVQAHVHRESCLLQELICSLPEAPEHFHTSECAASVLICTEESEEHLHTEECYAPEEGSYLCGQEETPGHTHSQDCYQIGSGFGCAMTEAEGHIHTAQCLTEETALSCGLEATQGHSHTEECYSLSEECPLVEHIHTESCYSDITADLETSDDWEMTLAELSRSPLVSDNVIAVAGSQLGYTESTLNFQVDAQGVRRGITRYGQWYGNPYGDWSAMFASFCLSYAGVEMPANAGAESMRLEWEAEGFYGSAREYAPQEGNLLFLHKQTSPEEASADQPAANAVAIITGFDGETITVIEGDLNDTVAETTYAVSDSAILGYGLVPAPPEVAILAPAPANAEAIAKTVAYNERIFNDSSSFVVYTASGQDYYAFDGNGNAVLIYIDEDGNILSDVADPNLLLWSFSGSNGSYLIRNLSTGRYMHAYPNNGSGVITSGAYSSTLIASGSGVKIRSNSEYARLDTGSRKFVMTQSANSAATYQFGVVSHCTLWLDGTNGGISSLGGSPNKSYTVAEGDVIQLPQQWQSPEKYSYTLRGWYDVTNSRYYLPGEEVTVTGNMVFYADWVASTYDIGKFNASVADTVSTNGFVTTQMFDYNYLFNVHSANASVSANAAGHSETWSMVQSGTVDFRNAQTKDFIFVDNDSSGQLSIPNNRSSHNIYPGAGIVTQGIYEPYLLDLLFSTDNMYDPATGQGVLGKTYLGTADHLFQIMTDPSDEHYGYYYYDSARNAASYNQSDGRFYVYDYLSATSDSMGGSYSDFLPLNSPYANNNGNTVGTFTYNGTDGEFQGVTHYRYDSKYNSGSYNSTNNVASDYAYGMKMDIKFYLPNTPGSGGNQDLNGNDMIFSFSGDDDLWVLVDGVPVLDLGGIHGGESGSINFSTGEVLVQGNRNDSLMELGISAGDHVLTVLYLERGSSQSNCSIYFNLAPRFSLQIRKEDVLTQQLLDGAEFSIFEDAACTVPAELWESENAYNQNIPASNTFSIKNGIANIWGLGAGNTYYIKETKPPDAQEYDLSKGVIRMTIDKEGLATYHVDVIEDTDGSEPSRGFTVHGVQIDEQTQSAYITVTNAPTTVTDVTTVQVLKKWEDTADHSSDYITAYLTVTDPDGTVRRIREILLSDENGWTYTWTNLPKYNYDSLSEVTYGIEESYESGYYSTVRKITEIVTETTTWAEAASFVSGETFILKNGSNYLSTTSTSNAALKWVSESTAKDSPLALWTATVSGNKVKFTNGAKQILSFNNGNNSSNRYFYATTDTTGYQNLSYVDAGSGFRFYYPRNNWSSCYMNSLGSNGRISSTTSSSGGMILTPMKKITATDIREVEDWAYQITNTPLPASNETSLSVEKIWDIGNYSPADADYEQSQVTVNLMANGVRTGRSVTLTLKNGWKSSFLGLPYADANGNVIVYTVEEVWKKDHWITAYGPIVTSGSSPPQYSTTITNTYFPGGPLLPSTGSAARLTHILCGSAIMLGTLVYGFGSRRKRERRTK